MHRSIALAMNALECVATVAIVACLAMARFRVPN